MMNIYWRFYLVITNMCRLEVISEGNTNNYNALPINIQTAPSLAAEFKNTLDHIWLYWIILVSSSFWLQMDAPFRHIYEHPNKYMTYTRHNIIIWRVPLPVRIYQLIKSTFRLELTSLTLPTRVKGKGAQFPSYSRRYHYPHILKNIDTTTYPTLL